MERSGIRIKPCEPGVWRNHVCKDEHGNVVCPILFKFKCRYCGATGKQAHTRRYCPVYQYQAAVLETPKPMINEPPTIPINMVGFPTLYVKFEIYSRPMEEIRGLFQDLGSSIK